MASASTPTTKVTLSFPADDVARWQKSASHWEVSLEEYLTWLFHRYAADIPRGSVWAHLALPASELGRWEDAALRQKLSLTEWVRRVSNYAAATGLGGDAETTLGRISMASLITRCAWCEDELPGDATIRRIYCSDACRVLAWRARRRQFQVRTVR